MEPNWGKYLIAIGIGIVVLGVIVYLLQGRVPWLGRMPGDINVERKGVRFYSPIVTMLIISVVLTLVVNLVLFLIRRFL